MEGRERSQDESQPGDNNTAQLDNTIPTSQQQDRIAATTNSEEPPTAREGDESGSNGAGAESLSPSILPPNETPGSNETPETSLKQQNNDAAQKSVSSSRSASPAPPAESDVEDMDKNDKSYEWECEASDRNDSADEALYSDDTSASSSGSSKGKKSNRCQVCRKKLGLTGFTCRCGGLFCSIHRYSDKHNCTFDYRELGAEEIRKNNPVVTGDKINKI